jgi:predicted methyltransferase
VAAVSSFQWATVLKGLSKDGVTMQEALAKYKMHPDVIAYSTNAAGASLDGEAGLLLDHQKDSH